jgi:hypothetical protein
MYDFASHATRRSVRDKILKYLFNPRNHVGWPKGRWFIRALGFNPLQPEHIRMLEQQIQFDKSTAIFLNSTEWGDRFKQEITITGPTGKAVKGIRLIWQRHTGTGIIKLVTLYPPKQQVQ